MYRRFVWSLAVVIAFLVGGSQLCHAQIKMLPRHTVDSLVRASMAPKEWCIEELQFDSLLVHCPDTYESAAPIQADFHFKNVSGEPLVVERVETSCSCADAILDRYVIGPGESATIKVTYRQKGHPGRHDRHVFIYRRDGAENSLCALLTLSSLVLD